MHRLCDLPRRLFAFVLALAVVALSPGMGAYQALAGAIEGSGAPEGGAVRDAAVKPTVPSIPALPATSGPAKDVVAPQGQPGETAGKPSEAAEAFEASQERLPISVELAPEAAKRMSADQRAVAKSLASELSKRLFNWGKFDFKLPGTVFDKAKGQLINVGDLFQAPTSDELQRIGTSDNGRGPKLTPAQRAQIKKNATFDVASVQYPGEKHVLQVGAILQKGQEAIKDTLREHAASTVKHAAYDLPARLAGRENYTLRNGVGNILGAIGDIVDLAVGLSDTHPKYAAREIAEKIEGQRVQELQSAHDASGNPLDLRLYDAKLMEKVRPIVAGISNDSQRDWQDGLEQTRARVEAELKAAGVAEADLPQALADRLATLKNEAFFQALAKSSALDETGKGLGKLLVDNAKAHIVTAQARAGYQAETAALVEKASGELKAKHPVLFRIPAWLDRQIGNVIRARADMTALYRAQAAVLAQLGLTQESELLSRELAFYADKAAALRRALEAQREGSEKTYRRRILLKRHWIINKDTQGRYYATRFEDVKVTTAYPGWRLWDILVRAFVYGNNAVYVLATSVLDGPLGLKSLFFIKPFPHDWTVNRDTGAIERSPELQDTLVSRVRSAYAWRREVLDRFNKDSDNFLPKGFLRVLLFFKADLGLGLIVPLVAIVGQLALTPLLLALEVAGTLTAWAWAPALGVLLWAANALIYDNKPALEYRGFRLRLLPPLRIAWKAVVPGVLQSAAAGAVAAVHALAALYQGLIGPLQWAIRQGYDAFMRALVLRSARVPRGDRKFFVNRISGPGLSANYFYQITPDLALLALQASLEAERFGGYRQSTQTLIDLPAKTYGELVEAVNALTGANGSALKSPGLAQLQARQDELHKGLGEATKDRSELYDKLLSVPQRQTIKLASQDYEETLKKAVVLTRNFYAAQGVTTGNWEALAKDHLARVFGDAFLSPLEATDKSLRLDVKAPSLADYISGVESGIKPEDVRGIQLSDQTRPAPAVQSKVPEAAANSALETRLTDQ